MVGRRGLGAILATVAALFVTSSAYLDWYGNRTATDTALRRLYDTSVGGVAESYWRSIALPLAIVTVIALVGLIVRSRLVFLAAWLVGAVTLLLYILRQANDDAVDFAFGDLQGGAWQALVALGVMLLGMAVMGSRPRPEVVVKEVVKPADEAASTTDEETRGAKVAP